MPTALFYNFSDYPFVGRWNGEDELFAPKEKRYMPAFLAQHFAKHLVNRELHRAGLDNATSPKAPEDVPEFNKLFRQAYIRDRDMPGSKKTSLRDMIDAVDLNRQPQDIPKVDPLPNKLGSDVERIVRREVSENEDPNFTREGSSGSGTEVPMGKAGASAPQIVTPPDFDEDEDDGYEGVQVGPAAAATVPGPDVAPAAQATITP